MHLRLRISPLSRCKDTTFFNKYSTLQKKFIEKVAEMRKKRYICTHKQKDSRIRQSESNDNRTRRHPVDLLAGHLFI